MIFRRSHKPVNRNDPNFKNRLSRRRKLRAEGHPDWKDKTDEELEADAAQAGYIIHEAGTTNFFSRFLNKIPKDPMDMLGLIILLAGEGLVYIVIFILTSDRLSEGAIAIAGFEIKEQYFGLSVKTLCKLTYAVLEVCALFSFEKIFNEIFKKKRFHRAMMWGLFAFPVVGSSLYFSYSQTQMKADEFPKKLVEWENDLKPLQDAETEKARPVAQWRSLYLSRKWPGARDAELCEAAEPEDLPADCQLADTDHVRTNKAKWEGFKTEHAPAKKKLDEHLAKKPVEPIKNRGSLPIIISLWVAILVAKFLRSQYLIDGGA
jgi:uncharacterized membrane protein YuzA (DUF378 family)